MKQRYIVASAWGRINPDNNQAEVRAVLSSVLADWEDDALAQTRTICEKESPGWSLDSWIVRPLISLV